MAKIDDGGVKVVTYYVKNGVISMRAVSEIYQNEEYYIEIDQVVGEDARTTVENYSEGIGMMPTWGWSGNVGQFAAKHNYKCSEGFKYKPVVRGWALVPEIEAKFDSLQDLFNTGEISLAAALDRAVAYGAQAAIAGYTELANYTEDDETL